VLVAVAAALLEEQVAGQGWLVAQARRAAALRALRSTVTAS
jgi:hypothetical protein